MNPKTQNNKHPLDWTELERCAKEELNRSSRTLTGKEAIAVKTVQGNNRHFQGLTYLIDRIHDATRSAERSTQEIISSISDTSAHPLQSLESLVATPASWTHKKTIGQLSEELFQQLKTEQIAKEYYQTQRLEDFFTTWAIFIKTATELSVQKIAVAHHLGHRKSAAAFARAIKILPGQPQRNDESIHTFAHRLSETMTPDDFRIAFRKALMIDAKATADINSLSGNAEPTPRKTTTTRLSEKQIEDNKLKNELIDEIRRRSNHKFNSLGLRGLKRAYKEIEKEDCKF